MIAVVWTPTNRLKCKSLKVCTRASSFLLLLKLSSCCIANPKCSCLKKKLFLFRHYFVGLLEGSTACLTWAPLCSSFWLSGCPGLKGQKWAPRQVWNVGLDQQGAPFPGAVSFLTSLDLSYVNVQQKLKLQCFLLWVCYKFHNVPPTTLLVKSQGQPRFKGKENKLRFNRSDNATKQKSRVEWEGCRVIFINGPSP